MSASKKMKTQHNYKKPNYYSHKGRKHYIEPGQHGFLATCNFREKDCIRECYNILNQYADELYGSKDDTQEDKKPENINSDEEEVDIATQLKESVEKAKSEGRPNKKKFEMVETGTTNCLFIKTMLKDPVELGLYIIRDIANTKKQKTRFLLRFIPIEIVCRANIKDIVNAVGELSDKHFLKDPKTFSVVFNRRYNNDINRDEVIHEIAVLVMSKNSQNKVDLKGAEMSIIVEVIKGLCCVSIVPDYMKLKKFNLIELCGKGQNNTSNNNDEKVLEETHEISKSEDNGSNNTVTDETNRIELSKSVDEKQERGE